MRRQLHAFSSRYDLVVETCSIEISITAPSQHAIQQRGESERQGCVESYQVRETRKVLGSARHHTRSCWYGIGAATDSSSVLGVRHTKFCISSPSWSRRAVGTSHIWHSERKTYCNTTRHDRTRHDTTLQRNPLALNVEDLSCVAFLDFAAAILAACVDQVNFVIVVTPLSCDPPCLVRVRVSMSLVGGVHSSVAVSTNPFHFAPDPEGQVWSSATVSSGHKRVDFTSATNTSPRLHARHCTEMLLPSQVRVGESVSNSCVSASPCLNPCAITLAGAFFACSCGCRTQQKPKDIVHTVPHLSL